MDGINASKLNEPFQLQREQCNILLDGMEKMCTDFQYYHQELGCKVLDQELSERIQEGTKNIIKTEFNLRNIVQSINLAVGDMREQFETFNEDEENEIYYPTFELQLKEQVDAMNNCDTIEAEMNLERHFSNINNILDRLKDREEDRNENMDDDDDDFAEISNTQQLDRIPIDPFTQKEIEMPVVNRVCKHVYEQSSAISYINSQRASRRTAKCPTIGCPNNKLQLNDLIPDRALKEKIDRLRHNS